MAPKRNFNVTLRFTKADYISEPRKIPTKEQYFDPNEMETKIRKICLLCKSKFAIVAENIKP